MITEAIVLAGGLGTRLRDVVPDLPKCLAPVAGKPFLYYVIASLKKQGIQRFVFSLGYKSELVEAFLKESLDENDYVTVVEKEPLGTGGGIALSLKAVVSTDVLIVNGDTLFLANIASLAVVHESVNAACTIALKPMENFDRYGIVTIGEEGVITSFHEKRQVAEGLINGGVYLLNVPQFRQLVFATKFSFEKDYLERYVTEKKFYGCIDNGYFIDIGIPADFDRAQADLKSIDNA